MDTELGGLITIFTEFYYWITVVIMFLIHVGLCAYEVGATRRKNINQTIIRHVMVLAVVTITWFLFSWWMYWAFNAGPGIFGPLISNEFTDAALPWSPLMGPNLSDNINGVFWAAFLLFSWTAAAIVSGVAIERVRTGAFLVIAVLVGSVTWVIDASWGWHSEGWMVQLMGYHDAYASGVIHGVAGGACLALAIVLGPRIGKFGPNGEVRDIKGHSPWLSCFGLLLIYAGFWGFYAACNIPFLDIGADGVTHIVTTNIYLMPTTLSAITFNFIMSLTGGLMAGYMVSRGDPYWTLSLGLAGIIAASAGNDLYHPLQAMFIGAIAAVIAYKLHFWVERRFKLDDPVGAIAVHGYAGTFGVIVAGFMLWGYPAAAPIDLSGWWVESVGWFGVTEDGYPAINPLGNLIGAFIMFGLLGFLPTYLLAKLFQSMSILREPHEVELAGADTYLDQDHFPYFAKAETEFEAIEKQYINK